MSHDLITVVTPTIGDSAGHLNRQAMDLRAFTNLPFRQIVSDDGTIDEEQKRRQQKVCQTYSPADTKTPMEWTENPGPVWGISYNFNHVVEQVKTPWAFLVEDGLRPGKGWLESAVDAIERIGNKEWLGHKVGMIGTTQFVDWHLALANAMPNPTGLSVMDFVLRTTAKTYGCFWGDGDCPNWNDGLWCWKRMWPQWVKACNSPEADTWPKTPAPWNFVDFVRNNNLPPSNSGCLATLIFVPNRVTIDDWPSRRRSFPAFFPGAALLLNMDAWRAVGRFADGCPFFEGHLGIRMAQSNYLSLFLDFPPWLHFGGMGFIHASHGGKRPRHHERCDGDNQDDCLFRYFGANGAGHEYLYALVYKNFPQEKQDAIARELESVDLYMDPAWEKYL